MNILMIGDTKSIIMQKIKEKMNNYTINTQTDFIPDNINYDFIFSTKIIDIKKFYPKSMFVLIVNNNLNIQELTGLAIKMKANLVVSFNEKYRITDPLGNMFYEGLDENILVEKMIYRLTFLKSIKRTSTISDEENKGALAWLFNYYKQEMTENKNYIKTDLIDDKVINFMHNLSPVLAKSAFGDENALNNPAFRCPKGFPSFKTSKGIFVSKRNIKNKMLEKEDFVYVYKKDEQIYYEGSGKPSVDTPIHLEMYKNLPNIKYIIHTHCYIKNAFFTTINYQCGAIEEADELLKVIDNNYKSRNKNFYIINQVGHGSIMMSDDIDKFKDIKIIGRKLPEYIKI